MNFYILDFALDAALATIIVRITAIIVTTIAYDNIGAMAAALPKISLKIALIASFQVKAATKPNAQ